MRLLTRLLPPTAPPSWKRNEGKAVVTVETLLLRGDHKNEVAKAGKILRAGGLVAIPTETVYGLAANALDPVAVRKIYKAKGRPSDNPLIVHIAELSQLAPLVREVPESAVKLAETFWPGPLTIILKKSDLVPALVSGGLETVAVRLPSHPVAQAVIRAAGVPLAAPSANLSGRPSPTKFAHVREDLTGRVEALLDGGDCVVGVESTVITLAEDTPRILRPGGVTVEQLQGVLGRVEVDSAVLHQLGEGKKAASPGMKYRHYSPRAEVILLDASSEEYVSYVNSKGACHALCFWEDIPFLKVPAVSYGGRYDSAEQAKTLFSALLRLDELGAKKVFGRCPSKRGVGLAVYNRLIRAAGFQVIPVGRSFLVGLTGPSGAGKSTVGREFQRLGCGYIDCDRLTRSPQVYDLACLQELASAFGADVVKDGALNRRLLADRAFAAPEGRDLLNKITFPRILLRVREEIKAETDRGKKLILLDAPTLFESGLDRLCRRIVVVDASPEERLARILCRDGISREQAVLRFSAQPDETFYKSRADYIIENSSKKELSGQIKEIFGELQGED